MTGNERKHRNSSTWKAGWWLAVLGLCCAFTACQPPADELGEGNAEGESTVEAGSASRAQPVEWHRLRDQMVTVLELDDSLAAELTEAFQSHAARLNQWRAENGADWSAAEKEMMAAARRKDLGEMRKWGEKATVFRDAETELKKQLETAVLALLDKPQLQQWVAGLIVERMIDQTEDIEWNEEQVNQLEKASSDIAARAMSEPNPVAFGFLELQKQAAAGIMDEDQKALFGEGRTRRFLGSAMGDSSLLPQLWD